MNRDLRQGGGVDTFLGSAGGGRYNDDALGGLDKQFYVKPNIGWATHPRSTRNWGVTCTYNAITKKKMSNLDGLWFNLQNAPQQVLQISIRRAQHLTPKDRHRFMSI